MSQGEIEAELPSHGRSAIGARALVDSARARLTRLFDCDLTQRRPFAILALFFYLARLPYINEGYGTDPDAWRVVMTAQHLWDKGQYFPSRLPGNPLHEFVVTLLLPGAWLLTGFATMTISLAGVYVFGRI